MMKELLQWLFVLQLQVSIMVMVILVLRIILKKAPRIYSYLLWLIVFVRLLCPVTLESPVSIIPAREQIMAAGAETMPDFPLLADNTQAPANPQVLAGGEKLQQTPAVSDWQILSENIANLLEPEQPIQKKWDAETIFFTVAGIVWLGVAAALMLYNIITLKRLKKRLLSAVKQEDGYFISTAIETPFVLGFFSPKIYLPEGIQGRELSYILEHEKTHLWRKDYLIKPVCLFLTCIYWFNPLVWAAFLLMGKDMEMSCDEHVLGRLGEDIKVDYSESLLQFASGRKYIVVPLAFGENGVKSRVRNVLRFKKAKIWISVVAVLLCVAAGAVLLTTRQNKEPDLQATEPNGTGEENIVPPVPTAKVEGDLFTAVNEWASEYAEGEADILYEPYQFYLAEPSNQVLIYYEKWTNAPELTILIEVLSYTETEEGYLLEHDGFKLCDSITSKEEFEEAYSPLSEQNQYLFVGIFTEIIAERMALGDRSVDDFKTPQKAAECALHLGAGQGEIRFVNEEETIAVYCYTFDKDGSQIEIPLHMEEFSYPIWTVGDVGDSEDFAKQQKTASMEYAGESYCFYPTGFYKILADGTLKCLYSGYVSTEACEKAVFLNGFAYFNIDLQHTPYSLDYADNAVVEVNLETEEWRLAYVDENSLREAVSLAESGIATQQLLAAMEYEKNLAELKAREEEMEMLTSFRDKISSIGINCLDDIPLKSQDEYGCSASFDLDLDGKADEIKLTTTGSGDYLLMINDASVEFYADNLSHKLQVIRPGGEELLLLLYDDGPSSDPVTTFYRYRGGTIKIIGSIPCMLEQCTISDTGEITGSYRFDAIQTEWAKVTWVYTGEGFEMKEQPYYDYSGDRDLTLLVELPVHSEMSLESESVTLAPQKVKLLHTDMEHWFYAEGENGVGGWFYIEKKYGMVPEAGVNVDSVFDGLLYVD
ncbi:MAG: hypothetical protein HDQ99_19290 [Lachnospiraceae bacterium]|nr:hypothetical protein [Lachnospiraceae bacterium]